MIEYLRIKNLILMELCEIHFTKGLTIITGETGAGKTALLQGLELILGQRADSSMIRKGEEKALVEASFDISSDQKLLSLLSDHGIEQRDQEPLIITREIFFEGKSRSYINRQPVTNAVLQSIGGILIQIIGQHSYHDLKSYEAQREILDTFGDYQEDVDAFSELLQEHKKVSDQLISYESELLERNRNLDRILEEKKEIEEAHLQENEEDELFETYSLYSKSQEIEEKAQAICSSLFSGPKGIIKDLSHHKSLCENMTSYHKSFSDVSSLLHEAIVSLQEVDHTLQSLLSSLDTDPHSLQKMETRLKLYSRIKKKYGPSFQDWQLYLQSINQKISFWNELDFEIESLKEKLQKLLLQLEEKSAVITSLRKKYADLFSQKLSILLQELNMADAEVLIEVRKAARSSRGDDLVHFMLKANKGEKPSSIKESSSGGELSRLLLAIKVSLLEKNDTKTLIFDEIDANVGGTTATLMAEKLFSLSAFRQVFCITHFPQMAKKADTHIKVYKEDISDRTTSKLKVLNKQEKQIELLRMLGEEKKLQTC